MTNERKPMPIIGTIDCFTCDHEVPVKQQSNGFASISCNWCGFQAYARNEVSDAEIRKKMKPITAASPPATVQASKEPAAAPAKKKSLLAGL